MKIDSIASRSTLGISQGAAFGAASSIVLLNAGIAGVAFFAFLGAMSSVFIILIIASLKRLSSEAIIYVSSDTKIAAVVFRAFGDVARSGWGEIGIFTGQVQGCRSSRGERCRQIDAS